MDLPTAPPPPAPAHHGAHGGVGFPWCWGGMGGMAGVRDQRVPGMGSETQRARLHQAARGNPGPGVGLDPKRQSAGLGVGVSQAGAAPRPTQGHAVQDPRCAGPATLGLCPQDLAWHRAWSPHWDSHRWGGGVPQTLQVTSQLWLLHCSWGWGCPGLTRPGLRARTPRHTGTHPYAGTSPSFTWLRGGEAQTRRMDPRPGLQGRGRPSAP